MKYLQLKIKEINLILVQISTVLETINDENFDIVMAEFNQNMQKVNELKQDLLGKYDKNILLAYESGLNDLTKQIRERFDNIIKDIKNEQSLIQTELINIQNKKKLVNYNR